MSKEELRVKYGKSKNLRGLINAAIRAELIAGDNVLDALSEANEIDVSTRGVVGIDRAPIGRLISQLNAARAAMTSEIERRYGLTGG